MSRFDPIFIIGAARSGTTMLGEMLSEHPDIVYWIEPKYIWRYKDASEKSDVRKPETATDGVKEYIHEKFESYLSKSKKSKFLEKTPSNCFRVDFMKEVFPNGKFIFLYRDGRDVARSAKKKWTSPPAKSALVRRLKSFEIPLLDLPYYTVAFLRDVVARQFYSKGAYIWGPLFPGIREVRATHSVIETCAIQWRESVIAMHASGKKMSSKECHVLSYENLVTNPRDVMKEVLAFCNLKSSETVLKSAEEKIKGFRVSSWRNSNDPEQIKQIESHISKELIQLGYAME